MSKEYCGKYEPSLVYLSTIKAIAVARRHGIEKYGNSENWRDVPVTEFTEALLRHIDAYARNGEMLDKDSGLPHLFLAITNLSYIIEHHYGDEKHGGVVKYKADGEGFGLSALLVKPYESAGIESSSVE